MKETLRKIFATPRRRQPVQPAQERKSLAESLAALSAVVLGVVFPLLRELPGPIEEMPLALRAIRIAGPFLALAACASVIWTIVPRRGTTPARYRFPTMDRTVAKLALAPLVLLGGYQLYDLAPTNLSAGRVFDGYLCDPAGAPLSRAEVTILDRLGKEVTVGPVNPDDTGYFATLAKPWTSRATHIAIGGGCDAAKLSMAKGRADLTCTASPYAPPIRKGAKTWTIACPGR